MSDHKYCDKCKDFHGNNNSCEPYIVHHEGVTGEKGEEVYAVNHYFAALRYAEDYNTNGDYRLMNDAVEISVSCVKDGETSKFKISAEPSIDYSADEIC